MKSHLLCLLAVAALLGACAGLPDTEPRNSTSSSTVGGKASTYNAGIDANADVLGPLPDAVSSGGGTSSSSGGTSGATSGGTSGGTSGSSSGSTSGGTTSGGTTSGGTSGSGSSGADATSSSSGADAGSTSGSGSGSSGADVGSSSGSGSGSGSSGADAGSSSGSSSGTTSSSGSSSGTTQPTWPNGKLALESAFSPDGKAVKLRFNKPTDVATAAKASAYSIRATDNSTVPVTNAKADKDKPFVLLTLDPNTKINSQLSYTVTVKPTLKSFDGESLNTAKRKAKIKRTVYLHLMFHQHQPTYEDPIAGQLTSPWVRKHATKDYYDMMSVLLPYPNVHLSMNLTTVLLKQLDIYYVKRMAPYVDTKKNTVDAKAFLAKWKGRTDPWIDLLLEPTPTAKTATEKQIGLLYADPWSCVSTAPVLMKRFPDYEKIRNKNPATLTQQDYLGLKIWFELAWMDPDFLHGPVKLASGDTIDLTDIIDAKADGTFHLKVPLSEKLANRIVAEEYKIMAATVPIHKQMAYLPEKGAKGQKTGQVEITTTPFYHPILPLIHDTNLMGPGQPFDPKPANKFSYPQDASAQVGRAVAYFEDVFGFKPTGMWPGEGSVAEEVIKHFVDHGIKWVATDQQVMNKSGHNPGGAPNTAFKVDVDTKYGSDGSNADELAVFFRNTQQSNDIGFKYQGLTGDQASNDLINNVLNQAPGFGAPDRVITLILDGENAWETFSKEHDGKGFFHKLYSKLEVLQAQGEIITVTGSEYLMGNPARDVPAHPVFKQKELEPLFPGSWIGGNFNIWIGEGEENQGWAYLLTARQDLAKSGLKQPDPYVHLKDLKAGTVAYETWIAFDEMYGAEGSDWFWWYGADMTSPSNDDTPFDQAFRTHLAGVYKHMNAALKMQGKKEIPMPQFKPIIQAAEQLPAADLDPKPLIDGKLLPNESEWITDGGFFFDSDTADAQANPEDWIAVVYYGFTDEGLWIGTQHNFDLWGKSQSALSLYLGVKHIVDKKTGQTKVESGFNKARDGKSLGLTDGAQRELHVRFKLNGGAKVELRKSDGKSQWEKITPTTFNGKLGGPVKGGKLIELFVPFKDLGVVKGDPIQLRAAFWNNNKVEDIAPNQGPKQLSEDPTNAVFVKFTCDVSEKELAVDTFGWIENKPPPKGKGIVYIAGNHPKLGMKTKWNPNKIALRDDGKEGDAKAGDNVWTRVIDFARGSTIKYKYTVGLPKDEGKWGGTEEFPLTERGLNISKDPKVVKMTVADVFADRPQPSGTAAKKTKISEHTK